MHSLSSQLKKFLHTECPGLLFEEKIQNDYFNFISFIREKKDEKHEFCAEDAMRLFSATAEDVKDINFSDIISMTGEINITGIVIYPKKTMEIKREGPLLTYYEEKIKGFFLQKRRFFPYDKFLEDSEFELYTKQKIQSKRLKGRHFPRVHFPTLKKEITCTEFFRLARPEDVSLIFVDSFEKGKNVMDTISMRKNVL